MMLSRRRGSEDELELILTAVPTLHIAFVYLHLLTSTNAVEKQKSHYQEISISWEIDHELGAFSYFHA
jgi:hypothetical protein